MVFPSSNHLECCDNLNIAIPKNPSEDIDGLYKIIRGRSTGKRPTYSGLGHVLEYKEGMEGTNTNKWVISNENGKEMNVFFNDLRNEMQCPERVMASGNTWSGTHGVVIECGLFI